MKKQSTLLMLLAVCGSFLISACTDGAAKFTGKWKSADSMTREVLGDGGINDHLIIKKVDEQYAVYPASSVADSLMYQYDEKADQLVCTREDMVFYIKKEKNGHLVLTVKDMPGRKLELEKAE